MDKEYKNFCIEYFIKNKELKRILYRIYDLHKDKANEYILENFQFYHITTANFKIDRYHYGKLWNLYYLLFIHASNCSNMGEDASKKEFNSILRAFAYFYNKYVSKVFSNYFENL